MLLLFLFLSVIIINLYLLFGRINVWVMEANSYGKSFTLFVYICVMLLCVCVEWIHSCTIFFAAFSYVFFTLPFNACADWVGRDFHCYHEVKVLTHCRQPYTHIGVLSSIPCGGNYSHCRVVVILGLVNRVCGGMRF